MKRLLPLLSICLLLLVSCRRGDSGNPGENAGNAEKIIHIDNPAEPRNGRNHYTLKEEYIMPEADDPAGLLGEPSKLVMDSKGNFYVLETQKMQILKFDNKGNFINSFSRRGEGPGEMVLPMRLIIDRESNILHILDSKNNKITRYNAEGEFLVDIKLEKIGAFDLYLVPGKFYYAIYFFSDADANQLYRILKYSLDGHILATSEPLPRNEKKEIRRDGFIQTGGTPFDASAFIDFDTQGFIYYSLSNKYEFTIYDNNFKKVRVVTKPEPERLKLSRETAAKWFAEKNQRRIKRGARPLHDWYIYPDYYPVFQYFLIDDMDRLLFRIYTADTNIHLDVFDREGVYLEEMILHPSPEGITLDSFGRTILEGNTIYGIVFNKNEQYVIGKYSIVPFPG